MAYEESATKDSKKTKTTTKKKIPDDPYFDSSSPAGSNFKQPSSTPISSGGFQNSSSRSSTNAPADPYFSNTSPVGSRMSDNKSTWRDTSSGWNVPPSGGTAAQGGGRYRDEDEREGGFESQRERSTVRDSNRDRGPSRPMGEGDNFYIGGRGDGPEFQGFDPTYDTPYDRPLVRMTGGDTRGLSPADYAVWRPQTMFGTTEGAEIQFSTPASRWVNERVEQAMGQLQKVEQAWEDTGYPQMIRDRRQRGTDDMGVWGSVGAGLLATGESWQKLMVNQRTLGAGEDLMVRETGEESYLFGLASRPSYEVSAAPMTQAEAEEGGWEAVDLGPGAGLSWGQALSAFFGAYNATFNLSNPQNAYVAAVEGPVPRIEEGMFGFFREEWGRRIAGYEANQAFFDSLPPDQRTVAAQAYYDLDVHGPDRQMEGMTNLLTWDDQIQTARTQAEAAYLAGDTLTAATLNGQADAMEDMTSTDIVEQGYNWGAEFARGVVFPDPMFDWLAPQLFRPIVTGGKKIWGPAAQAELAESIIDFASKGERGYKQDTGAAATLYREAVEKVDEWVRVAQGEGSELYELWTGGKKNFAQKIVSVTPESEITRIQYSLQDSLGPALSRAGSRTEARIFVSQLLDGELLVKHPEIGRDPFTDPALLRDLGLISRYKEDILKLPSLNEGKYSPVLVQGEIYDFLQSRLLEDFGLWPKGVPHGVYDVKVSPYKTKGKKDTSKFQVDFIGSDGKVISSASGLYADKALAEEAAENFKTLVKEARPGMVDSLTSFTKVFLATQFIYTPLFVIGNTLAATAAFTADGFRGVNRAKKILGKFNKMYDEASVTGELLEVMRAQGAHVTGEAAQLTPHGRETIRTSWGYMKDRMPKKLRWMVDLQDRTSQFLGRTAFGTTPLVGEEFWRLNYFNQAFDEMHDFGRQEATSVFTAGLKALGVDPAQANALAYTFYTLSAEESARTVLKRMRELAGAEQVRAGLSALNVGATSVSARGQASLADLIQQADPNNMEEVGNLLGQWLKKELSDIDTDMMGTELPNVPFREVFNNLTMTQESAEIVDQILTTAKAANIPVAEARANGTRVARQVTEAYMGEIEAIRRSLALDPTDQQLQLAATFYYKTVQEKRNIQRTVDSLYAQLSSATEAQAASIYRQVEKIWSDYSANVKTWGNDLRVGAVAGATAAPDRVYQVGDSVRLSDGTPVRVKQVLTENEVVSYVVEPLPASAAQPAPAPRAVQAEEVSLDPPTRPDPTVGSRWDTSYGEGEVEKVLKPAANGQPRVRIKYADGRTRVVQGYSIGQPLDATPAGPTLRPVKSRDWAYRGEGIRKTLADAALDQGIEVRLLDGSVETVSPKAYQERNRQIPQDRHVVISDSGVVIQPAQIDEVVGIQSRETVWKNDNPERVVGRGAPTASAQAAAAPAPAPAPETPPFVERTIRPSEIAAGQASDREIADIYESLLDEYMSMDGASGEFEEVWQATRGQQRGDSEWPEAKERSRAYVHQARANMLLTYGAHKSAEFFDEMLNAELKIDQAGNHVVSMLHQKRELAKSGAVSWDEFRVYRDDIWKQYIEFAHGTYQYATIAGLRHTVGAAADDAMMRLPLTVVEPVNLNLNDLRLAQMIQESSLKGDTVIADKRIVNSINKHLGFGIEKLEDLNENQLREAWRYYRRSAADQGINFESAWFRHRMASFPSFSGMADPDQFVESIWRMEAIAYREGNVMPPNFGTARAQRVGDAVHLAKQVYDNIGNLTRTTIPNLSTGQRGQLLKLIDETVAGLENIRYRAATAGQEAAGFGMLNYWKRRNFDKALGFLFGFPYYISRAPFNWARRLWNNPGVAYDLAQYNRTHQGENDAQIAAGAPSRIRGTLPNPIKPALQNYARLGLPGAGVAETVGEWMPSRFYEPSKYLVPYGWPNDFIDPENATTPLEKNIMRVQRAMPIMMPYLQIPMNILMDAALPKDSKYGRMSDVQVGDYFRVPRMIGYGLQGMSPVDENRGVWGQALNQVAGKQIPGWLGDQFDTGRIGRAIFTGIASGDYDEYYGELALAQMYNSQHGLPSIPEMEEEKTAAEIKKVIDQATRHAGQERFANLIMGYLFRMPGQDYEAIEAEVRALAMARNQLGYGPDNMLGSQDAVNQFMDQPLPSSPGVNTGDALSAYWSYPQLYGQLPEEQEAYGSIDVRAVNRQARKELEKIYTARSEATLQFIFEQGNPTEAEVYAFGEQFREQIAAVREEYPSATVFGYESEDMRVVRDAQEAMYDAIRADLASDPMFKGRVAQGPQEPGQVRPVIEGELTDAERERVRALMQPHIEEYEEVLAKYPGILERDDPFRSRHQNPFERADAEIQAVVRYEPPGKPIHPGDDASPIELNDYYRELGVWTEKRLNYIERVGEQWVLGSDTQPGKVTGDLQMARAVVGRMAQELVDTEILRYQHGVYIEWYMRENVAQEHRQRNYRAEEEAITNEFGRDGFELWLEYKAIPDDPTLEFPSWTPAHEKFLEKHPEVQAMKIYDASPEVYTWMVSRGGGRVFEALAMYPGGGTRQEKKAWKARYGREAQAVYDYFGVSSELKSSRSQAWEEGQLLGENWQENMMNRPTTENRSPIGMDSRAEYETLTANNTDYSIYGGQMAIDQAYRNQPERMNATDRAILETRAQTPLADLSGAPVPTANARPQAQFQDYNQYLATVYPMDLPAPVSGRPGVTALPATTPSDLEAYREAVASGEVAAYVVRRKAAIEAQAAERSSGSSSGGGGGYSGYWYRNRYYRRRGRGYRRYGRRGYRRYGRSGGGGGRRRSYGGGGYGGGSTVEEGQELFLKFDGPPRIYAREFSGWLMPSSDQAPWRPTGISRGFTPSSSPQIRPWRRIPVRS